GGGQPVDLALELVELLLRLDQSLDARPELDNQLVRLFHGEENDFHVADSSAPACPASSVSNELPQPHERTAFGFWIAKPLPWSVSTKSIFTPFRSGALAGSTNTFTPPKSPTQSVASTSDASDMPYE